MRNNLQVEAESWAPMSGFPGYFISTLGNVKNKAGVALNPWDNGLGYKKLTLPSGFGRVKVYVHRLVALEFIQPEEGKEEINHKDGDPSNNRVSNLEWVNSRENKEHARDYLGSVHGQPSKPVILTDASTGGVYCFKSVSEAARRLGICRTNVFNVLAKRRKTVSGYFVEYA